MEPTASGYQGRLPHGTTKLLKGVEKSYDRGVKLLEFSKLENPSTMEGAVKRLSEKVHSHIRMISLKEEIEERGYDKMRADKLSFWQRVVGFMEKAMTRILRGMKIRTPWKYTRKEYQTKGSLFESKLRQQAPEGLLHEAEKIVKRYEKENAAEAL